MLPHEQQSCPHLEMWYVACDTRVEAVKCSCNLAGDRTWCVVDGHRRCFCVLKAVLARVGKGVNQHTSRACAGNMHFNYLATGECWCNPRTIHSWYFTHSRTAMPMHRDDSHMCNLHAYHISIDGGRRCICNCAPEYLDTRSL